uniref:Xylose isomerase domain protein TIM barrel n=1 Tax=Solibacter usitatus (strain Ellin6076) TaxID=234267 RepID=Q020H2_SOLUE
MLLGAVTYNVLKEMDLDTVITTLEAAGFGGVELRTGHKHGVEPSLSEAERTRVRERFEHSKVKLLSYGTTCEFQSADAAERTKQIDLAKRFVELAHDTGAVGVKVRPNGLAKGVPRETTIQNIAAGLRTVGDDGYVHGVEIWLEVHGAETQVPATTAEIMRATNHKNVGLCWNSNPTDVIDGSVKANFELLRPWLKSCHINELVSGYPYKELFALMKSSGYTRWTLCEANESKEPERFLKYYRALWRELGGA